MTEKHPYMSGSGGLTQAVGHLRKSFPPVVTADTLKKLGIAPNNETYVMNILRFVSVLDKEGKKTSKAASVFSKHEDQEFQKGFAALVESAYADLFSLHGKDAWALSTDKLISYFRSTDDTSSIVGQRQAGTFQALAGLSGYKALPPSKSPAVPRKADAGSKPPKPAKPSVPKVATPERNEDGKRDSGRSVGLTVRIEINLPVAGDQATYDRIFKSIRENFLNGE